jgi:colicin import membrane protein
MWQTIRENPRAVTYAVLMHLGLLALLVFSLDWTPKISRPPGVTVPIQAQLIDQRQLDVREQKRRAEQREAEEARQKAANEQQRKVEEQRQAEAERKRKAELEAKQKAEQAAKQKAELAAKQKAEAERKRKAELEAKQKAEQAAKQKAELAAKQKAEAERKRKAELEARQKAQAEAKRKAEEAQRRDEQALQSQLAAEQERMEAGRVQGIVEQYIAYIQDRIQRSWLRPQGSAEGLSCVVQVSLIPGGDVARVEIVRSSGDPLFDRSVETAVYKAAPLPLPPDATLFKHFRELRLIFKPT